MAAAGVDEVSCFSLARAMLSLPLSDVIRDRNSAHLRKRGRPPLILTQRECAQGLYRARAVCAHVISFLSCSVYRRPGFNCVVKQLRFWLFKIDCEYKDCDLRVLRIGHTCVIYTLRSNNCELREKSQFTIFKLRN